MVYHIILKHCRLSQNAKRYFEKWADKLTHWLPSNWHDTVKLFYFISWHQHGHYYDGSLALKLPQKSLFAHFRAKSMYDAVKKGSSHIIRMLSKYKRKHLGSHSKYYQALRNKEKLLYFST